MVLPFLNSSSNSEIKLTISLVLNDFPFGGQKRFPLPIDPEYKSVITTPLVIPLIYVSIVVKKPSSVVSLAF